MYTTIPIKVAIRLLGGAYDYHCNGYQASVNGQLVDIQLDHVSDTAEICSSDNISLSALQKARCRVLAKYF